MKVSVSFAVSAALVTLLSLLPSTTCHGAPGDLYVVEPGNGVVSKFTPDGTKAVFASGISQPGGLAFDRTGNLFVAESATGTILKFTADGTRSVFASGLSAPVGLAFDGAGNLLVSDNGPCDAGCGTILKFTPDGTKNTFVADTYNFVNLVFDPSGNLLAAIGGPTFLSGGIVRFTPDGTSEVLSDTGGPGIAFDAAGARFEANFRNEIIKCIITQVILFTTEVQTPFGLVFDGAGNLFETDDGTGSIQKFAPDANKTIFASGLTQPSFLAFEPLGEKLRNISARGLVGTGDDVLIGGFIVGGNALDNNSVLVRAIGPSLAAAGVANPLADPTLELRNSSGGLIASNDDWQIPQKAQITATGLAPIDPNESAIFATLPAGNYTAIVSGAGGTTGTALVEVYSMAQ
jgi:sugar lactone lactonase YvrE